MSDLQVEVDPAVIDPEAVQIRACRYGSTVVLRFIHPTEPLNSYQSVYEDEVDDDLEMSLERLRFEVADLVERLYTMGLVQR